MLKELSLLKGFYLNRLRNVPSKLNLNITSLCNSRCLTCNIWTMYRKEPLRASDELRMEEIKRLLSTPGLNLHWLTITGGEPFLRGDFDELLDHVLSACPSIRLLSIPSNGLDTGRIVSCLEKIKDQKRLLLYVTFSLDGPPDVHDHIRGVPGGHEKTWKTYMAVRRMLAGNDNFRVALETTISKYNAHCMAGFLSELLTDEHKVIVTMAHNAYQYRNETDELLPGEAQTVVKEVVKTLEHHIRGFSPEGVLKRVYLQNCVQFINHSGRQVMPCTALQNSLAVDPWGNVFPCTMWDRSIGSVREHDHDLMAIWHSSARMQLRKAIRRGVCPSCWTPCEAYQSIAQNFLRSAVLKNIF